jgi:hypothetical protein
VTAEDAARVRVNLDLGEAPQARALKAEVEPSDAGED